VYSALLAAVITERLQIMGNVHNIQIKRNGVTLLGLYSDDRKVFRFFLIQKWYEADTLEAIWGYWEQVKNKEIA